MQHPHAGLVSVTQPEVFNRLKVSRLGILQLKKVFMHDGDQPGRARLAARACRFADNDHRRRSERRKGGQQIRGELSRTNVDVLSDFIEIFWRRGVMDQELGFVGDQ